jgi:quercetin dioxygenase-like cupin family protein
MRASALIAVMAIAACSPSGDPAAQGAEASQAGDTQTYVPPSGSNEIFRQATAAAPGHELIVADLSLPADAVDEPHYHPWEEYLYVIAGSAVLDIERSDERILQAGESFVIPRETVHTPRAGPTGVRAIVIRVHKEGDPVMVPAGQ